MADPKLRDEVAAASYAYDEALMDYQGAIGSRDPETRAKSETRLRAAAGRLSQAQSALVASRQPSSPATFATFLGDPTQQLDPDGVVMQSIRDYQNATSDTPSAATASEGNADD